MEIQLSKEWKGFHYDLKLTNTLAKIYNSFIFINKFQQQIEENAKRFITIACIKIMSSVKQQHKETMPHREPEADNHSDENFSRFCIWL